jgi:ribosomal protein L21E
MMESTHIHLDEEKVAKERKRKLRETLIQTFKENQQVRITVPLHSASCSMNDRTFHQRWNRVC